MSKEVIIITLYLSLVACLIALRHRKFLATALVAFLLSLVWTGALGDTYNYTVNTMNIAGLNLYALFAWSLGLLVGYMLYTALHRRFPLKKLWQKLALFNVIYIPLLIAAETIAYHVFGVINASTAMYGGLPLCDCLHAPLWIQFAYLAMGSVFLLLTFVAERYNPLDQDDPDKSLQQTDLSS